MKQDAMNPKLVPVVGLQMLFVAFGALVLVFGIGGIVRKLGDFSLGLSAIAGILLNLALPHSDG